ncbi:23S rRNA (uracil(1939)-C(5))-methyltransferase RlmD [Prochlorococcus marinus]|uniref:23S rRNA (uracil(1939)-C(5))-methyltransferase RlmD n=1 Tax=Prochlorococcus marinus TaxID=1219 RepID=UPI0009B8B523|nr:23S rRNA (uracil(1939)-C(5))-methyltransferase RlmD [Prochlorococcus marinus]
MDTSGRGICRHNNFVLVVAGLLPGEEALVKCEYMKKNFCLASLIKIIKKSPLRVNPKCSFYSDCGGCSMQEIEPHYQFAIKKKLLINALSRIGKLNDFPEPISITPSQFFHYRNKSTFPVYNESYGNTIIGYYQRNSHKIVDIDNCPVLDHKINKALSDIRLILKDNHINADHDIRRKGGLRHISIRSGINTNEVLITFVSNFSIKKLLFPITNKLNGSESNVVGILNNIQPKPNNKIFGATTEILTGRDYIYDKFCHMDILIGSTSFFQVNLVEAEKAINCIRNIISNTNKIVRIIDAYSGIGTMSIPLASDGYRVIGIEINNEAHEIAIRNAEINNIKTITFENQDVTKYLPKILLPNDFLILDPPRKGLDPSLIDVITKLMPIHICYLSCNPATLARDLSLILREHKYSIISITAFDFFPQTTHLETLVYLKRLTS